MKFRLVDRILTWERDRCICGIKAVSFEEYCAKSRLGAAEQLPESLALESLGQLASWLLILSSDFTQMGLVAGFERITFGSPLRPGQRMVLDMTLRQVDEHSALFDGIGQVDGQPVVTAEGLRLQRCPLSSYYDPLDMRILCDEIHPTQAEERP